MTPEREALWDDMTGQERRCYAIGVFHTITDVYAVIHDVTKLTGPHDWDLLDLRERLDVRYKELAAEFVAKGVMR